MKSKNQPLEPVTMIYRKLKPVLATFFKKIGTWQGIGRQAKSKKGKKASGGQLLKSWTNGLGTKSVGEWMISALRTCPDKSNAPRSGDSLRNVYPEDLPPKLERTKHSKYD